MYWANDYHHLKQRTGQATARCPRCTGSFHKLHTGAHLLDRYERLMCSYAVLGEGPFSDRPPMKRRLALLREVLVIPECELDRLQGTLWLDERRVYAWNEPSLLEEVFGASVWRELGMAPPRALSMAASLPPVLPGWHEVRNSALAPLSSCQPRRTTAITRSRPTICSHAQRACCNERIV